IFHSIVEFETEKFVGRAASNIYHDDLAEINQPFYFHEFAEQLAGKGLQYLSEVTPVAMTAADLSRETQEALSKLEDDTIRREHYLDFIKCRRFRSTLVCHDGVEIQRRPATDVIQNFYIESHLAPTSGDPEIMRRVPVHFATDKGSQVDTDHPLTKAALI